MFALITRTKDGFGVSLHTTYDAAKREATEFISLLLGGSDDPDLELEQIEDEYQYEIVDAPSSPYAHITVPVVRYILENREVSPHQMFEAFAESLAAYERDESNENVPDDVQSRRGAFLERARSELCRGDYASARDHLRGFWEN